MEVNDLFCEPFKKLNTYIVKSHNCRLILYLKYVNLSCKISAVQVAVILASTVITFFETLKKQMHINNRDLRVISISLSTFIAMSLSIARYLKMDDSKENIYKLLQHFSIVEKELKLLKSNVYSYEDIERKRIIDSYNEAFTLFNTILSYNENIYYRRQILNMNFEDKINDLYEIKIEELSKITIDKLNRFQRTECIDNCLRKIFGPSCCFVHRYRYNEFFKEYDYDSTKHELVYNHTSTICEKCCTICFSKCNNCLDSCMDEELGKAKEPKEPKEVQPATDATTTREIPVNEVHEKEDVRCGITDIVCFRH